MTAAMPACGARTCPAVPTPTRTSAAASSSTFTAAKGARSAPSATTSACCSTTTRAAIRSPTARNTLEGLRRPCRWEFSPSSTPTPSPTCSATTSRRQPVLRPRRRGGCRRQLHPRRPRRLKTTSGPGRLHRLEAGRHQEFGGFGFGLHYVDTDVDNADLADERVILSIAKLPDHRHPEPEKRHEIHRRNHQALQARRKVREAYLSAIGVQGITVTKVKGFLRPPEGPPKLYRGAEYVVDGLPRSRSGRHPDDIPRPGSVGRSKVPQPPADR